MNLRFAIIRIAARHLNEVSTVVNAIGKIKEGPEWVADRLEPTNEIVAITYQILDEVDAEFTGATPLAVEVMDAELAKIKGEVTAAGIDYLTFINVLVPLIQQVYQLIRNLQQGESPKLQGA